MKYIASILISLAMGILVFVLTGALLAVICNTTLLLALKIDFVLTVAIIVALACTIKTFLHVFWVYSKRDYVKEYEQIPIEDDHIFI